MLLFCNTSKVSTTEKFLIYLIYINTHNISNLSYICYVVESFNSLECNLHIDALSLVNLNVKSAELHAILVESTCRNIRLIEMQQENQSEDTRLSEIMHFKPQSCGHLFTVAYPSNSTNDTTSKILITCLLLDLFINHAINITIGIYIIRMSCIVIT